MTVRRSDGQDGQDGLRELISRLRRVESVVIPSFPATIAAARLQTRRRLARRGLWLYGAVSTAAVVVVTGLTVRAWFIGEPALDWSEPLGVQLSAVSWESPTDFLLKTPDDVALRGLPQLVRLRNLPPAPPAPVPDTND